jgi:hypothetical protein
MPLFFQFPTLNAFILVVCLCRYTAPVHIGQKAWSLAMRKFGAPASVFHQQSTKWSAFCCCGTVTCCNSAMQPHGFMDMQIQIGTKFTLFKQYWKCSTLKFHISENLNSMQSRLNISL